MERPGVGVNAIIIRGNKVLLGKRKGWPGEGQWAFPGGRLKLYEDVKEGAVRETAEETGLVIKNLKIGPYTNDIAKSEQLHYLSLIFITEIDSGEPKLMEPDKFYEWKWFEWDKLPEQLFLPVQNLVNMGFNPFRK